MLVNDGFNIAGFPEESFSCCYKPESVNNAAEYATGFIIRHWLGNCNTLLPTTSAVYA